MRRPLAVSWMFALLVLAPGHVRAQTAVPVARNDYSADANWLCRPGRHDACDIDRTTAIVAANGTVATEPFTSASNPPIDCFYLYPTVSTDQGDFSDMTPDRAELNAVAQQFARFGQVCRLFAPSYRQATTAGLLRRLARGESPASSGLNFDDVRDAWRHYIEHDNRGRGFVLVGHSQGARIVSWLLASEIDGSPIQKRLVSAILLGGNVEVPKGSDVGGTFRTIPLCHAATDVGCAIAFSSFRATFPPPTNTRFGKAVSPAMAVACTNPAALAGGSGALQAYLDAHGVLIASAAAPRDWVSLGAVVTAPFVSVPGLLTAVCVTSGNGSYLEVSVHGDPADPRTDDIGGDYISRGQLQRDWGLHLVDMNLVQGNLLGIVRQQARSFAEKK